MTIRFLILPYCLALLTLPATAGASPDGDRSWDEQRNDGLRASRLAVSIGSLNVVYLGVPGAAWLAAADDQNTTATRRGAYAIGSIGVAGAVANIVWLVYAGETLGEYKQRTGNWTTVRRARLNTAFTGVDTALRLPAIVGGSMLLAGVASGRLDPISRLSGLWLLIPNLLVLPFHIWALYANGRELKHRKHEGATARARRVQVLMHHTGVGTCYEHRAA